MPSRSALRFKSGKGKSIRSDKLRAQKNRVLKGKITHLRTFCLTFGLFFVSLVFLVGFLVYKKLNENFVSASSYSEYNLDYPSFSYIVVDSFESNPIHLEKLNFVILDKNSSKVLVFDIPLDVELDLPGKYSEMPLNKVFALGGLNTEDKLEGGVSLLNTTLFKTFGFDVSNYILIEKSIEKDFDKLLYEGKKVFPLGGVGLSDMERFTNTNLTLKGFYQIQKFLNLLSADRFLFTNLTEDQVKDPSLLDDFLEDLTLSSSIASEKQTVAVLNGTDLPGVATLSSRVINNIGGRVVAIENANSEYTDTVLITDEVDSQTVAYISKVFNVKKIYTKQEATFINEDVVSRSNITLILGFDLAKYLY